VRKEISGPTRQRLDAKASEHLHRLMAGWQLIADLAFADLLLFRPVEHNENFRIVGQLRPYTARTLYPADLVGEEVEPGWHPFVERAWLEQRRLRSPQPVLIDAEPVRVEAVPVRHKGTVIAVLSVEAAEAPARPTGRLEAAYLRAADALLEMVADGTFPFKEAHDLIASPRVGDGLVVLDASGRVEFASPNATSAFRRMGTNSLPLGQPLPPPAAVMVAEAMAGRRPIESDMEMNGAVTDLRVVPLLRGHQRRGALVLCREVTELRRRDRVISRREATIREVHHRVKNNLQTVASLLRLQARRLDDHPLAVAALEESVRRIAAIALVHETLTEELEGAVDMAEVARRVVRMLEGSLGREDVRIAVDAQSVRVDAHVATPLSVVLNELVQNAVEHGLGDTPGTITVHLHATPAGHLELEVTDEPAAPAVPAAPGLVGGLAADPPGADAALLPEPAGLLAGDAGGGSGGLGLRLVRGLVEEELGGRFSLVHRTAPARGSVARAVIPPQEAPA
jgi:two-component sensor histidine kinase